MIEEQRHSLVRLTVGFGMSLVLTLTAFLVVGQQAFRGTTLVALIIALALIQLTVQLRFFLHLGLEPRPRWKLLVFGGMVLVLVILVFGSLWIMKNLDYNMQPTRAADEVFQDEGMHR